ncbi:hypothetical protein GGR51DRAFT_516059 [Nemania sp. FL0031]|nr:hypothetical protein GGR51DRAFT_516059 [Nemania sp. FL0031]
MQQSSWSGDSVSIPKQHRPRVPSGPRFYQNSNNGGDQIIGVNYAKGGIDVDHNPLLHSHDQRLERNQQNGPGDQNNGTNYIQRDGHTQHNHFGQGSTLPPALVALVAIVIVALVIIGLGLGLGLGLGSRQDNNGLEKSSLIAPPSTTSSVATSSTITTAEADSATPFETSSTTLPPPTSKMPTLIRSTTTTEVDSTTTTSSTFSTTPVPTSAQCEYGCNQAFQAISGCPWGCPGAWCAGDTGCMDPYPCYSSTCCLTGCLPGWSCSGECSGSLTCVSAPATVLTAESTCQW